MSRSSSWIVGDLDTTRGGILETGFVERFLEGWILYLLSLLVGNIQGILYIDIL